MGTMDHWPIRQESPDPGEGILARLAGQGRPGEDNSAVPDSQSRAAYRRALHYRDRIVNEVEQRKLDQLANLPARQREALISAWVTDKMREEGEILAPNILSAVIAIVLYEMVGLGPLQPLIRDDSITEIIVNWVKDGPEDRVGHSRVYVERKGDLHEASPDIRFENQEHLRHIIDRIVSPLGRRIDETSPYVDARLPEGHRVNAIIPPLAVDGPLLTIRKFRPIPFSDKDLLKEKTLDERMLAFLRACVKARFSILISGGTGSGKTTTLNVLASFIPHNERIVTIEDSAELRFFEQHPDVARLEAKPPNIEGKGEVTIRDLVRNSLRMRPDRIVVGEVRGGEALDMLQAMNTGHEGSMVTLHANSTLDAFSRLENMVMMAASAEQLPLEPIRRQMASAIHIVVQQNRLPTGERKIVSISEVLGVQHGQVAIRDLFLFQQTGLAKAKDGKDYKVEGEFTATGLVPACLPLLRARLDAEEYAKLDGIFSLSYFEKELGTKLLQDTTISEIMINAPDEVYVEQGGEVRQLTPGDIVSLGGAGFRHAKHLEHIVETIAARIGRRIDEQRPIVDARLPDGSRVNAILPPLTLGRDDVAGGDTGSPRITIRRFPLRMTHDELLQQATWTRGMLEFLHACVQVRLNILISGGTGSGKTTLLNVFSSFIPDGQRIITIEDVAELRLQQPHWLRLETRPPDDYGEGEVTIRDLVRNSLRMRPDRIIVGECRGGEALDMLQAMNTGHEGSMTTIHANSPQHALSRLQTMVRMADEAKELSLPEILQQMSVIDLVVQVSRLPHGSRKITSIQEIASVTSEKAQLVPIFTFEQTGLAEDGSVIGHFQPEGHEPRCLKRIRANNIVLPESIFDRQSIVKVRGKEIVQAASES